MRKRQEIQQEITTLNQQLRQHQIEQRKEQQSKGTSIDDMLGGSRKTAKPGKKGSGLSQESMQAMISADNSMKQAEVQGSMAVQMEGRAGVLESEIQMDKGRGANTKKKEEELADLQANAQEATAAQISTLADASKVMEEASKAEQAAETTESRNNKNNKTEQIADNEEKAGMVKESTAGSVNNETAVSASEENVTAEIPVTEAVQTVSQPVRYTSIDICL